MDWYSSLIILYFLYVAKFSIGSYWFNDWENKFCNGVIFSIWLKSISPLVVLERYLWFGTFKLIKHVTPAWISIQTTT